MHLYQPSIQQIGGYRRTNMWLGKDKRDEQKKKNDAEYSTHTYSYFNSLFIFTIDLTHLPKFNKSVLFPRHLSSSSHFYLLINFIINFFFPVLLFFLPFPLFSLLYLLLLFLIVNLAHTIIITSNLLNPPFFIPPPPPSTFPSHLLLSYQTITSIFLKFSNY